MTYKTEYKVIYYNGTSCEVAGTTKTLIEGVELLKSSKWQDSWLILDDGNIDIESLTPNNIVQYAINKIDPIKKRVSLKVVK